ncbi:MAG TPA: sodium:solute symporter family protein [Candidatus Cloacimonadota bacterium]|nr:sodium:solute symporter family protein [Candidatus Cloacimonadota bacterium]
MKFQSSIDFRSVITSTDWIVFFSVLALTLAAIIYGQSIKKKIGNNNSTEYNFLDLLLMGRQLTLPMFVATLVATWYGGIFGVTKIAFEQGIYNFITQGLFWYIAYIIFALFIVKKVAKYQAVTLPDLVGKMFGPKSEKLSAVFNFFNVLPIAYVISLGLFIQTLFGGSFLIDMLIGTGLVILYTLYGGFRAVVFSDIIQFFVMCLGVFLVLVFSVDLFGGLSFLKANLPATHFSPTGGVGWGTTLVWGFIALSTLVDPNFYQRVFAAKNPKAARNGILISTVIWFLFDICTTGGAMYARAVIPQAASDKAYLIYALQILPNGLRGFVLAGILATILSTLDSYLFIAGTTVSYDMMPAKWKGKVSLYHLGIVTVGLLAIFLGKVFDGNIKIVWKTLGSYWASCLLLPILYGYIFPKKIKDMQFIFASIIGIIAVTVWRNVSLPGFWQDIDELYMGIIATSLGLVAYGLKEKIKNKKTNREG